MDEAARTSGQPVGEEENGRTPERNPQLAPNDELRADIEETRRELGDTVEELAAKTDVKAHAQAKIDEIKQSRTPLIAAGVVAAIVIGVVLIRR